MKFVKQLNWIQQLHHYTLGYGQMLHGLVFMWTKQDRFSGKCFVILVDAHSKWPEVLVMNFARSQSTIEALHVRTLFGRYGLPKQLVSDNGLQFISSEFIHFPHSNGVKHFWSARCHPSSSSQAERFVQTLDRSFKASKNDGRSVSHRLAEFLVSFRTTPHATTNSSPGELFLKYSLWTRYDLLRSPMKGLVEYKQVELKQHHDRRSKLQCFFQGRLCHIILKIFPIMLFSNALYHSLLCSSI